MNALQRLAASGLLAGVSLCVSANPVSIDSTSGRAQPGLIVFDQTRAADSGDIVNLSLTASTTEDDDAILAAQDESRLDPSAEPPILFSDDRARAPTEIEAIALFPDDGTTRAFDDDAIFAIGGSEWTARWVQNDVTTESVPAPLLLALLGVGLALLGLFGRRG